MPSLSLSTISVCEYVLHTTEGLAMQLTPTIVGARSLVGIALIMLFIHQEGVGVFSYQLLDSRHGLARCNSCAGWHSNLVCPGGGWLCGPIAGHCIIVSFATFFIGCSSNSTNVVVTLT